MSPAARAFSWWPKVDLWPLFAVCGSAVGFCSYSCYRHLAINPEVLVDRNGERRHGAGEMITLEQAAHYRPNVFRNMASTRYTPGAERPNVNIF